MYTSQRTLEIITIAISSFLLKNRTIRVAAHSVGGARRRASLAMISLTIISTLSQDFTKIHIINTMFEDKAPSINS